MADLLGRIQESLASRYRIERELGSGGMAVVFLAEDLRHGRRVALKVLRPELAVEIGPGRFLREIETAARLTHPHILPIHDSGEAGGFLYFVMPYVEGESLRARLAREKQLPLDDALRIAREVADALSYAHSHGVVHRDIKPENILLQSGHAVVADFGIARAITAAGDARTATLTAVGTALGTPAYMSPEQASGSKDVDGRSDLYSLGCVLYEMLAGQPPFTGPTVESLMHQHLTAQAPSITAIRPAVPGWVAAAVQRALAKTPADRFSPVALFAEALASRESAAMLAVPSSMALSSQRRRWVVAAAVVMAAIAVGVLAWNEGWLPGSHRHAPPDKKDWILVAEFDGPPDDSTLAMTARDLISAALDQSEIVKTVPQDQIRQALEAAGKPTSTRVDPQLAQELAYRSAVRAVLEGKLGRLGGGYSLVLRVVDAESLRVVLTESAVAKNEDALIPTLGRLAEKLRAGLGENRGAIQATREMGQFATPSFEAFRLYVQAGRNILAFANRDAIQFSRDALALDPDFASAWWMMAMAFANLGQPDSSLAAYDEALRRPQRLTTVQRLHVQALRASTQGDLQAALDAFGRALRYDPTNRWALMNGAIAYANLGRFEEALESTRRAERLTPFQLSEGMRNNEAVYLCYLGRVDEARQIARHFRGPENGSLRAAVEIAGTNWAAAERIADTLLTDPGLPEDERAYVLLNLASARAARGALKAASAAFEQAENAALSTRYRHASYRDRMMLTAVSRGAIPLPTEPGPRDSSAASLITRGMRAANEGDRSLAQRLLTAARGRPRWELGWQGAAPALLQAQIEVLAGRSQEAVDILRPIASLRVEIGNVDYPAGMSTVRWALADAFERLGQPDSAAAYLERITSDPTPALQEWGLRGVALPFAHRRLVMLYSRMGRIEDARRHWRIFSETVRTPDPEIRPLIEEARTALLKAEEAAAKRASGA